MKIKCKRSNIMSETVYGFMEFLPGYGDLARVHPTEQVKWEHRGCTGNKVQRGCLDEQE